MPKAFCLLNHVLTENQTTDLKEIWHCEKIMYPPEHISAFWAQIPEADITGDLLRSVTEWLESETVKGDIVVIQGEFGATFAMVDWCMKRGLVPVHSVTQRVSEEKRDGETVYRSYIFKHIRFRKYRKI